MRERWARLSTAVQICILLVAGAALFGAVAQVGTIITAGPIQAVRIVDGLSNQMAAVDHAGAVSVTNTTQGADIVDSSNRFTIAHITSLTHVSGLVSVRDDNCLTCRMRVDHFNVLVTQPHISGAIRAQQVTNCGSTATQAVATNANRRDLMVQNYGNNTIFVGYGTTGHVALSTTNGIALHANTALANASPSTALWLYNYQGPLSCMTPDTNSVPMAILEILR